MFASISEDNSIKVWTTQNAQPNLFLNLHTLDKARGGHSNWVSSMTQIENTQLLASGSFDTTIKVWNVSSGSGVSLVTTFDSTNGGHSFLVSDLVSLANSSSSSSSNTGGVLFASSSFDFTIKLWTSSQLLATFNTTNGGHTGIVWSMTSLANNSLLASSSDDRTVKIWDISMLRLKFTLASHTDKVVCLLSLSPSLLASGSHDKTVKVWSLTNNNNNASLLYTYTGHTDSVVTLAYISGGTFFASGSTDGTVKIWNYLQNRLVYTLNGMTSVVSLKSINNLAISGHVDGSTRIWSTSTGMLVYTFDRTNQGHALSVNALETLNGGSLLVTGSDDDTIKLWSLA
jgi:WD40 repeat protein